MEVRIWYVGLATVDLHIRRSAIREARGGHAVAPEAIRARVPKIAAHLVELAPLVTQLRLYDNSVECDLHAGEPPQLLEVLHVARGEVVFALPRSSAPAWALPILDAVAAQESGVP
jgi:hypothetical protein